VSRVSRSIFGTVAAGEFKGSAAEGLRVAADRLTKMIDATYNYFGSLGNFYQDPAGLAAVREVRDRMVNDLTMFARDPSRPELADLCAQWRATRVESDGPASYPPDMFIESVCQVIELS
jgi:hypothetical protein